MYPQNPLQLIILFILTDVVDLYKILYCYNSWNCQRLGQLVWIHTPISIPNLSIQPLVPLTWESMVCALQKLCLFNISIDSFQESISKAH